MNKLFRNTGITILSVIFLSGCSSIQTSKTVDINKGTTILLMPPHDFVQNGKPHPVAEGSGKQLQESLQRELNLKSSYDVVVFEMNDEINYTNTISEEAAINEAIKTGADYSLILALGEFRNAAPFTFRTDFVTLESGFLIDVKTKEKVWTLKKPYILSKTNIGSHYGLIDDIAKEVSLSISQ